MLKTTYDERCGQYNVEKDHIGVYIAYYLRSKAGFASIAIDGGSTNKSVIDEICRDALEGRSTVHQVITNHLEGLYMARDIPEGVGPTWRCTGGILRRSRKTFVEGAEDSLRNVSCEISVIGINGFEPPYLETTTRREHEIKRSMIDISRNIVFSIDSSKWGCPAGEKFETVHDIVNNKKKVTLVTCYPIRHGNESKNDLEKRVERFLSELQQLIRLLMIDQKYKIEIVTAYIDDGLVKGEDTLAMNSDIYNILKGRAEQGTLSEYRGFAIRIDLWDSTLNIPGW